MKHWADWLTEINALNTAQKYTVYNIHNMVILKEVSCAYQGNIYLRKYSKNVNIENTLK